jgi:hypothetical protein
MLKLTSILVLSILVSAAARADIVTVEATGRVVFNGITTAPLNAVTVNQQATMSFTVDSNNFLDGIPGDTRGYVIDQASFSLAFSGGVSVGLLNPFPVGLTPYFTLVEGFPVADGFFVSTSPSSPGGVHLSQTPIRANLDLGYAGTTLTSLDILAAAGVYNFTGLTRFAFNLWRVVMDNVVLDIEFQQLSIVPGVVAVEPATWSRVKAMYD